nr:DNA helicase Pif1-like protein [Tanacetum cinerariifolium]
FFIISSIAVQTPGSSISKLLAVGTTFTGSGNLYCQWELSPGSDKNAKATTTDISFTKSYISKVSKFLGISLIIAQLYKPIENYSIHKVCVVDQAYYKSNNIEHLFTNIRFNCLFQINEPIVLTFILDIYSQVTVQTDDYGYLVISFMIQHEFITFTLAQFGQILKIPYNDQVIFTNEWDLASLEYSRETEGPYCTDLPTPDDIYRLLELERVVVDHTIKSKTISLNLNQILTKELSPDIKQWEELIRENVFRLGEHQDCMLSHQHDDDDVNNSQVSTPSLTTYLNSLNPVDYQNYQMPSSSKQTNETLFARQTTLLNQTQRMHEEMRGGFKSFGKALKGVFSKKKNAPNEPSKTPSIKDTSSSLIDYIPKSLTSSTSFSPNGYFNPPTSPHPRVSLPQNASMDITLTLSPITPLDVQLDTPSPSPRIFGHPIPWNILEAHRDSCLCCIHNRTLIFGLRDELQCMFSHIEYMLSQPLPPSSPPPPSSSLN